MAKRHPTKTRQDFQALSKSDLEKSKLIEEIIQKQCENRTLARPWWLQPSLAAAVVGGVLAPLAVAIWSISTGAWDVDAKKLQLEQDEARMQLQIQRSEMTLEAMRKEQESLGSHIQRLRSIHELTRYSILCRDVGGEVTCEFGIMPGDLDPLEHIRTVARLIDEVGATRIVAQQATDELVKIIGETNTAARITHLEIGGALVVGRPEITDKALTVVIRFPKLRWIGIASSEVTEAGITTLLQCPSLEAVQVGYLSKRLEPTAESVNQQLRYRWKRG